MTIQIKYNSEFKTCMNHLIRNGEVIGVYRTLSEAVSARSKILRSN